MNIAGEVLAEFRDNMALLEESEQAAWLKLAHSIDQFVARSDEANRLIAFLLRLSRANRRRTVFEWEQSSGPGADYWSRQYDHYDGIRKKPVWFSSVTGREVGQINDFPWISKMQQDYRAIQSELLHLRGESRFRGYDEPQFMAEKSPIPKAVALEGTWSTFDFYHSHRVFEDNCAKCPKTVELLRSVPGGLTGGMIAQFSAMSPGVHVQRHRGVFDYKLRAQLCLMDEPRCQLNLGGQDLFWEEGKMVVFDDTYSHEVWNRGERTRIVLLFDFWHPDLSSGERRFIGAINEILKNGFVAARFRGVQKNLAKVKDEDWWV